jgi:4-diphosphocytidyl-2-C-methyl-D-erythritol kinase
MNLPPRQRPRGRKNPAAAERVPAARAERAPAKVNLTLRVIGPRADGYHDIESLVAFAALGDTLTFSPAPSLALAVQGPTAGAAGDIADNLVLKAARTLAERVAGLSLGYFVLTKRLPVAAGIGGGSADAAAALRLLARASHIALDDRRLIEAARATGADVPVCLDPRPRVMRGIGDVLSDPLDLPRLPAVLVNPGVAVATKDVFALLRLAASSSPLAGEGRGGGWCVRQRQRLEFPPSTPVSFLQGGKEQVALLAYLASERNDLEASAIKLQPVIGDLLTELRETRSCQIARMSGSGATCFGLFDSARAAAAAASGLRARHPTWWVRATTLGG